MGYVATIGGGCGAGAVILTLFTTKGGLCCADQNAGPAAWEGPLGRGKRLIFSIQLYDQPFLFFNVVLDLSTIPGVSNRSHERFILRLRSFVHLFSFCHETSRPVFILNDLFLSVTLMHCAKLMPGDTLSEADRSSLLKSSE